MADHGHGGHHGGGDHSFFGSGHGFGDGHNHGHDAGHAHGAPHGGLFRDLGGGHAYAVNSHVGHHHGVEGLAHISIADALTLGIVIQAALSHGGPSHGLHSFGHGHMGEIPGLHGWMHASNSDPGRKFNIPGIERDLYAITVLKWPHAPFIAGATSMAQMLEPLKQRILATAARLGMIGFPEFNPTPVDGNKRIEKTLLFLASNEPFGANAMDKNNPPNLWWNGATGSTGLWRIFLQHKSLAKLGKYEWCRTYTVVSLATYRVRKANDCETRVSFSVWAKPRHTSVYKPIWTQVALHRALCEDLADDTNRYLDWFPPSRESIEFREQLKPEQLEVPGRAKLRPPALVVPTGIAPVPATFVGNGENVELPDGTKDPRI